ncbi:hypothetical protein [Rhodanobacter ginsenosidimutans]|uniref:Major facilitator superfamily (MFS) profile domain-containing protein n=1 Tax=Rhodanobacter ginsenosidimutans TaxID=490571 RepID=A0ABW0JVU3_9GAMM
MTDHVAEAAGLDSPAARVLPRRHVVAVALGNALEFYDFITYAFSPRRSGVRFSPRIDPGSACWLRWRRLVRAF